MIPEGRLIIEGYGGGGFHVSGQFYKGSILIAPGKVLVWPPLSYDDFTLESLTVLRDFENMADILLIGSGKTGEFLPTKLRRKIKEQFGVVAEVMDTGAACRTYNVLMSEDRAVAAALIAL